MTRTWKNATWLLWLLLIVGAGCAGSAGRELAPYRQAVKADPQSAETHYELGSAALALERYREALRAFQRCLALQPDHIEAQFKLASALMSLDRALEGVELYRSVLVRESDHREANIELGRFNLGMILTFEQAGQIWLFGGNSQISLIQMAMLDAWKMNLDDMIGIYQETLDIWRRMVKLEPENPEFWCNLGVVGNLTNNFEASIVSFEEALRHREDWFEERELLEEIYQASLSHRKWVPPSS